MSEYQKGDEVTWKSTAAKQSARWRRKYLRRRSRRRQVRAAKDNPQYLVKSDKSGGEAVHKPSAAKKKS